MPGLLQHLVQRVFAPEASLRPHAPNPFEPPRLLPLEGPVAPLRERPLQSMAAEAFEPLSAPGDAVAVEAASAQPKQRRASRRVAPRRRVAAIEPSPELELEAPVDVAPKPAFEPAPVREAAAPPRRAEERPVRAPLRSPRAPAISDRLDSIQVAVQALEPASRVMDAPRVPVAPQLAEPLPRTRALPPRRDTGPREWAPEATPESPSSKRPTEPRPVAAESGESRLARVQPQQLHASTPFALTRAPLDPPAAAQPSAAPTVQISIGRVEIRAHTTPARSAPRPAAKPAMSLSAYLDQRGGKS